VQAFVGQILQYLAESDDKAGQLAVTNVRSTISALAGLHTYFAAMFVDAPDYFDAIALDEKERAAYAELDVLLAGQISEPVSRPLNEPVAELRMREARRRAEAVASFAEVLQPLARAGRAIIPPRALVFTGGFRAATIGVEVARLDAPFDDLVPVLDALRPVAHLVDWFYLVPIHGGERLSNGAYSVSAYRLRTGSSADSWSADELTRLAWSLSLPIDVPPEVTPHLPSLPLARVLPTQSLARRAVGLHTSAKIFARRSQQIAAIGGDEPLPDHLALRSKLRESLAEIGAELRATAETLRLDINGPKAVAASFPDTHILQDLVDYIEALVTAKPSASVSELQWSAEEVEDAAEAVEAGMTA
jgi:hypothetical protein